MESDRLMLALAELVVVLEKHQKASKTHNISTFVPKRPRLRSKKA